MNIPQSCLLYMARWMSQISLWRVPFCWSPWGRFWSWHVGGTHFLLADGAVRFLSTSMDHKTFKALSTRAGNEVIGEF
jgi:hypothetical protein